MVLTNWTTSSILIILSLFISASTLKSLSFKIIFISSSTLFIYIIKTKKMMTIAASARAVQRVQSTFPCCNIVMVHPGTRRIFQLVYVSASMIRWSSLLRPDSSSSSWRDLVFQKISLVFLSKTGTFSENL